jgi:hypothetical protein
VLVKLHRQNLEEEPENTLSTFYFISDENSPWELEILLRDAHECNLCHIVTET